MTRLWTVHSLLQAQWRDQTCSSSGCGPEHVGTQGGSTSQLKTPSSRVHTESAADPVRSRDARQKDVPRLTETGGKGRGGAKFVLRGHDVGLALKPTSFSHSGYPKDSLDESKGAASVPLP